VVDKGWILNAGITVAQNAAHRIFRKIEPYLTFLNVHQLERQGADIQSKIEELEVLLAII
jgi:hypothetical protein